MYKEVVEKGLREVDNEVDKKINFLGRKHGRGDDAWSKAGAVTSGDYSRPQLKHYHKCAPGLGRCPTMASDQPHYQPLIGTAESLLTEIDNLNKHN